MGRGQTAPKGEQGVWPAPQKHSRLASYLSGGLTAGGHEDGRLSGSVKKGHQLGLKVWK